MKPKFKTPPKQPWQITISDLSYSINNTLILDKLTCAIAHHKTPIVGIIGHNGAGKTTLAKIITGHRKSTGNIYIV